MLRRTRALATFFSPGEADVTEQEMQHFLTKLAAAAIVVGAAIGANQAQAGPLPTLKANGLRERSDARREGRLLPLSLRRLLPLPLSSVPLLALPAVLRLRLQAVLLALRLLESPLLPGLVVARTGAGGSAFRP